MRIVTLHHRLPFYLVLFFMMTGGGTVLAGSEKDLFRYRITWNAARESASAVPAAERILSFRGSALSAEYGLLPVFIKALPFDAGQDSLTGCVILNPVVEKIPDTELLFVKGIELAIGAHWLPF